MIAAGIAPGCRKRRELARRGCGAWCGCAVWRVGVITIPFIIQVLTLDCVRALIAQPLDPHARHLPCSAPGTGPILDARASSTLLYAGSPAVQGWRQPSPALNPRGDRYIQHDRAHSLPSPAAGRARRSSRPLRSIAWH